MTKMSVQMKSAERKTIGVAVRVEEILLSTAASEQHRRSEHGRKRGAAGARPGPVPRHRFLDSAQRRTQTPVFLPVRPLLVGLAVAFVVGAQVSPLAHWADTRSFAAHMAQHLLIGDLAPLALAVAFVGAARGPLLSPAITFP